MTLVRREDTHSKLWIYNRAGRKSVAGRWKLSLFRRGYNETIYSKSDKIKKELTENHEQ